MPNSSTSVASPPVRPLKRSASTMSLPTPPRTTRRRKNRNGKQRSPKVLSEEEEAGRTSSDEESSGRKFKKRRISSVGKEPEDEEAFWLAEPSTSTSTTVKTPTVKETATESDSDSETTSFLSRRGQKSSTMGSAPVSPPPSHRRPPAAKVVKMKPLDAVSEEEPSPVGSSPPETPKSTQMKAMMDSPNNPFLASPLDLADEADESPRTKEPRSEKPTVSYVFRGVKKTYPNPYYDHENDRPFPPDPRSLLSPDHPDYSPDLRGAPRALWPRKKRSSAKGPVMSPTSSPTRRSNRTRHRIAPATLIDSDGELDVRGRTGRGHSPVDDEVDDEELPMRPTRLFASRGHGPGLAARS